MGLMGWLAHIPKTAAAAVSSKWARGFVLVLALSAPIFMCICIWEVHAAGMRAVSSVNHYPTNVVPTAVPSIAPNNPNILSATTVPDPAPTTAAHPSGTNNSAACQSIAASGDKDLNTLNAQIAQDLTQAKKYASTGDFTSAGSVATEANQLGSKGAADQTRYQQELNANNCSVQLTAQPAQ
jgi:hypothetical protein